MTDRGEQGLRGETGSREAWRLPEQEPTNLLALWCDDQAPTVTEVSSALARYFGEAVRVLEEVAHDDPEILWSVAMRWPTIEAPVVLWAQPARPMADEELDAIGVESCRWIVGLETLLDPADPLTDFVNLMKPIAGALPDVPAVLDVNTTRWHARPALDELFSTDEVEPPAHVLWIVQLVQTSDDESATVWLHTHGLARCGKPELEMLGTPADFAESAAEMIDDIAALVLERHAPPPGAPFEIGTELAVTLQPWQVVAPTLDDGVAGGMADRQSNGDNAHAGPSAVICGLEPPGGSPLRWHAPCEMLQRYRRGEAAVFRTARATERQARLARLAWDQIATAFASVTRCASLNGPDDTKKPMFGVKAGFESDDGHANREHLWFQVRCFNGQRVQGELMNDPISIERLKRGDVIWIERDDVSDWRVMTEHGCFGPCDVAAMWRSLDEMAARNEPS
jgi:uncharacterized protein YegJ (DUF2314 family)